MEKRDIFRNTLLIFTSDHGEELGEHNIYFEHGHNAYQSTMHVPLIMTYPGRIPEKKTVNRNLVLVDIFPTILSYAGIQPPEQLEGRSLHTLIEGKNPADGPVFSEGGYLFERNNRYHSVLYLNDYKLIHDRTGRWELYNLVNDPYEQQNLINKKPENAALMKKMLLDWESKDIGISEQQTEGTEKLSKETVDQLRALGYVD